MPFVNSTRVRQTKDVMCPVVYECAKKTPMQTFVVNALKILYERKTNSPLLVWD